MSENKAYSETYSIEFVGLDTLNYAIVKCDSSVNLELTSNGFHALNRSIESKRTLQIDINNRVATDENGNINVTLNVEELLEPLKKQLDMRGVASIRNTSKQLSFSASPRERKAFRPDISNVEFLFEGMCGLNGIPIVNPDTVWLYGSRGSLDKIEKIAAAPQTIKHIFRSGSYKVRLERSWEEYSDLRASVSEVEIILPVESFIEKTVTVPVTVVADKGTKKINLYPDAVTVHFMVPRNEYATVDVENFQVTATMQEDNSTLRPVVTRFPSNVRITEIDPPQVQFIVITNN